MLNTLSRRFVLSHVLPLLIVIPIMGIALIYVLETQVLQPSLASELQVDALLIAAITDDMPGIWQDAAQAQAIVARVNPTLTARVMLLDAGGRVLASSEPDDTERVGQQLDHPALPSILAGEINTHTDYGPFMHSQIADVFVPVLGSQRQVMGVVRLSYPVGSVFTQFVRLRYLIAGVLAVALVVGSLMGWFLAVDLSCSLKQVTQDIYRLASGQILSPLAERGTQEVRLLLRAFNALAQRLQAVEETRRQLLANLTHELGRPLGALNSAVQALQNGAAADAGLREELLAGMATEIQGLQREVAELAQLRDQVVGRLQLERHPILLGEWLANVLSTWRETAQSKGLCWEVSLPPDLPVLDIDPNRVGQALGNLLSNAVKYTPAEGMVSVSAGAADGAVWIRVSDTGLGMLPEEQAHIFTPFYRGRQARGPEQGMGLGLSIARDLIVAHDGRLEVESAPGVGSHFTLWLPIPDGTLADSEREKGRGASHAAPAMSGSFTRDSAGKAVGSGGKPARHSSRPVMLQPLCARLDRPFRKPPSLR
jgi:two-component system sensor histidine kinase BaeS